MNYIWSFILDFFHTMYAFLISYILLFCNNHIFLFITLFILIFNFLFIYLLKKCPIFILNKKYSNKKSFLKKFLKSCFKLLKNTDKGKQSKKKKYNILNEMELVIYGGFFIATKLLFIMAISK